MTSPVELRVELLGGFRIRAGADLLLLPPSARRVVAYLAVHGALQRADVAGALWPDHPQQRAGAYLRTSLWRLHRVRAGLVVTSGGLLRLPEASSTDVAEVERWALDAIGAQHAQPLVTPPRQAGKFLLPGWDEPWLDDQRERLRLLQLQAFESTAARLLAADRAGEALPYVLHVVQSDPLRESGARLMVEIQLRQGNVAEAGRAYDRYRRVLRHELGLEPGIAITSLIGRYLPLAGHEVAATPAKRATGAAGA